MTALASRRDQLTTQPDTVLHKFCVHFAAAPVAKALCSTCQGLSPSGRAVEVLPPALAEPGALNAAENETAAMQFMMEAFERELKRPIRNLVSGAASPLHEWLSTC